MSKESKTHFRRVYKSDHLSTADLEDLLEQGHNLIFTIAKVQQEFKVKVAGKTGDFNICYFKEKIKPLVLNVTNAKAVRKLAKDSPFVEDWANLKVQLYIDANVKMKGEVVGGVRVSPKAPVEFTKNEIEDKINNAKSVADLKAIKPLISQFGLQELSTEKFKELKEQQENA